MNRKQLILLILLAVFGLGLAYSYWAMPRQERVTRREPVAVTTAGGRVARTAVPAQRGTLRTPVDATRLHLELLEDHAGRFPGYKRNIFGRVEPPPPPPAPAPKAKPVIVTTPPPPPPPEVAPPVQRELAHFNFLGYLEKDGQKTVFLSRDKELYLVKKGGRFGSNQEFQVTELTPAQLVIQVRGDSRQTVVPLVENQPLIPQFHSGAASRPGPTRFVPSRPLVPVPAPPRDLSPESTPLPTEGEMPPETPATETPAVTNEVGQ